jgi:hypothetical protein
MTGPIGSVGRPGGPGGHGGGPPAFVADRANAGGRGGGPPAFVADLVPDVARERSPVFAAMASQDEKNCGCVDDAKGGVEQLEGGGDGAGSLAMLLEQVMAALAELTTNLGGFGAVPVEDVDEDEEAPVA